MVIRSADLLTNNILSDPTIVQELVKDPAATLRRQADIAKVGTPLDTDKWIYRVVVGALGGVLIIVASGLIFLSATDAKAVPDGLIALGSAAGGALAGLLAPSPGGRQS